MSYILDALRQADAERERDPARGIHAQPGALQPRAGAGGVRVWPWVGAVAGLAVVAAFVFWRPAPPAVVTPVAGPVTPSAPAPVAPPANAPAVPAGEVQPAAPPMPVAPIAAAPTARPAPAASAAQAPVAASPPSAAAAAAAERVVAFADLPPDVQRELPKLAINGGVHSENAAQRMLIVGGQVMLEGAELAPGLVLEQIRPKAAVLRFRGMRYSVPY